MENRMNNDFVQFDHKKLSIEQKKKIMDSIYIQAAILAEENLNRLRNENLMSIDFYKLWKDFYI